MSEILEFSITDHEKHSLSEFLPAELQGKIILIVGGLITVPERGYCAVTLITKEGTLTITQAMAYVDQQMADEASIDSGGIRVKIWKELQASPIKVDDNVYVQIESDFADPVKATIQYVTK